MASNGNAHKYITLVSEEGHEFTVLREAALVSPIIKTALSGPFQESKTGEFHYDVSGPVLEKVVEYFHYSYANRDKDDVVDMDIPVDLCLEIIVAADYFQLDSKLPMQDFKH